MLSLFYSYVLYSFPSTMITLILSQNLLISSVYMLISFRIFFLPSFLGLAIPIPFLLPILYGNNHIIICCLIHIHSHMYLIYNRFSAFLPIFGDVSIPLNPLFIDALLFVSAPLDLFGCNYNGISAHQIVYLI